MSTYILKNDYLTVMIQDKGATLWSIKDMKGTEYLWQGDPKYWVDRAPNLFPYIARMTEGKYTLDGQTYEMDIHGFAKDMLFQAEQVSDRQIHFWIEDTDKTYEQYPYKFRFGVSYELAGNKLNIAYSVQNKDDKVMYFAVGGHPGFHVPFEKDTVFEDYYLEFDSAKDPKKVIFSDDCFVMGREESFPLEEGIRLPLYHEMFDHDAIVLTDMADAVTLKAKSGSKSIRVTYPDMSYLGLWHMPKTDAPYICIEPWSSLPSRKGIIEDIAMQPNMKVLEAGGGYRNMIGICIEGISKR